MATAERKTIPNGLKFMFGGMAGMCATAIIQPFDLVKTRMQVQGQGAAKREYNNSLHCIQTIVSKEGPLGLYAGLSAALLRQATYTTTRLGLYTWMIDKYKDTVSPTPTVLASMAMAITAGAVGAFVGTPADVALIRMSSDGRLPPAERRNYTNVVNALIRIVKEEGMYTLWRGTIPTVGRAMVVNMSQLASYSQFKRYFKTGPMQLGEGVLLVTCSSMMSGLLTSIVSLPLDIAKTRIQNMKTADYTGMLDVLIKTSKREGVLALWRGFTPYYCRLGPQTVFTFIFLEQFNRLYYKYVLKTDSGSSI